MAKSRPSVQKRNKERNRIEKRLNKQARRSERQSERKDRDETGVMDPDLAGIVPGPHNNNYEPDPLDRIDYDNLVP